MAEDNKHDQTWRLVFWGLILKDYVIWLLLFCFVFCSIFLFSSKKDLQNFYINVTFHFSVWLNVLIHNFLSNHKQSKLCNEMCGLPLTINGFNKSPIYLCWRVVPSLSPSLSQQRATFKPSRPVILINSVYLGAVIIENGSYDFSRLLVLLVGGWPRCCLAPHFPPRLQAFGTVLKLSKSVGFPCICWILICTTNSVTDTVSF